MRIIIRMSIFSMLKTILYIKISTGVLSWRKNHILKIKMKALQFFGLISLVNPSNLKKKVVPNL